MNHQRSTSDLYILTDADSFVTSCRATVEDLRAEVVRCNLTAPIQVRRWNMFRPAPAKVNYPRWKEVETFQWP